MRTSLYHDLKRGGRKFARALKSISLHNIIGPAIHLKPTGVMEFEDHSGATVRSYTLDDDSDPGPDPALAERHEAGARIQRIIDARIAANPGLTQAEALTRVLKANPVLADQYRGGGS